MKNPKTNRHLPGLTITILLGVASLQILSLSRDLAMEPGSVSHAGIPHLKGDVLYVSSQGNDAWSGRLPEPNAARTDGPFATLARARDSIRLKRAAKPLRKPVTVYVRGGMYTLSAPLVFLPEDSGTANCPITYASYPGEKVVLSGGRAITGWKKAAGTDDNRPELWTAEVSGVQTGEWYFHQLFVDGQRRQRARSPNTGFYHADGEFLAGNPSRFKFHPGDIHAAWAEQGDVEVVGLEKWAEFRIPLKAVDSGTNTVTLSNARQDYGDDKNARYWVENAADALDAPGEWFLDRRSGTLSYLAMPGEDVSRAQCVAPFLPQLIRLEGGRDGANEPVHDIVLRGFTFAHTDWPLSPKGYVDEQAASDIPAAVELVGARHCRIEQCTFVHLGQYALDVHQGSQDDAVVGNEMTDLGAGGVKIGDREIPKAEPQATSGISVSQNYIHNIGIVYLAAVGVWIGQSSGNTVAHNEIGDTYYTGISLGWTWGYGPTAAHDNRIEFNSIYNIGRGLLSDMGCIYSLGIQPGTVERYNLCHDVSRFEYGGWGIYTDEGSSQIVIENNIVYRTQDGGFHQHYGRENIVRNNIFAFGQEAQLRRTRKEPHRSFTFERNIVYWKEGNLLDGEWSDDKFHLDYNLYWQAGSQPIQFGKALLPEWQQRGQDVHSLTSDPLFADPDRGDFTLKPDSPAAKIGFQPIDMSQIGRSK
jgi:parallel beta-helix repeat protein